MGWGGVGWGGVRWGGSGWGGELGDTIHPMSFQSSNDIFSENIFSKSPRRASFQIFSDKISFEL